MAAGVVIGYFATSALALPLGGLAPAVSLLSFCMPLAGIVFLLALPESRGLELEDAHVDDVP